MSTVKWGMRRLGPGAWEGIVELPAGALFARASNGQVRQVRERKPIKIRATSAQAAGALSKAANAANAILDNPILSSALPPGTGAAIKGVQYLANSAAAGKLASAAKNVVGKGAKRLFKSLSSLF